ncbi:MAG: hypothetical protein J0L93_10070 [Deltaproteobacteria bacterium]|nr:hypothetical protein [Deltaproteobacteria bacterium]
MKTRYFFRDEKSRTSTILFRSKKWRRNGFSLIELSISLLLVSAFGLGIAGYMKKTNTTLRGADITDDLRTSLGLTQKRLMDDIKQTAKVYPSCSSNQASSAATAACTDLKIRGAFVPLPGTDKADVDAMTGFALPSNLSDSNSTLSKSTDSIILAQYDFSQTFDCRLNSSHTGGSNPSTTSGTSTGAERLWASWDACHNKLSVGKLYVLLETFTASGVSTSFGNVFQITSLTDAGTRPSTNDIQIDAASTNNLFNQQGGLGLSGFTSNARIYPIKLVEWTVASTGGLYRREIKPSSGDLSGYQAWVQVQANVEGIQFYPLTITTTSAVEHQRTMQFTSNANNNGVEDIRGISPWVVLKSNKASQDGTTYDNPQTASSENDAYPRKNAKFFVQMRNF